MKNLVNKENINAVTIAEVEAQVKAELTQKGLVVVEDKAAAEQFLRTTSRKRVTFAAKPHKRLICLESLTVIGLQRLLLKSKRITLTQVLTIMFTLLA